MFPAYAPCTAAAQPDHYRQPEPIRCPRLEWFCGFAALAEHKQLEAGKPLLRDYLYVRAQQDTSKQAWCIDVLHTEAGHQASLHLQDNAWQAL
jgi:hypothetical protein